MMEGRGRETMVQCSLLKTQTRNCKHHALAAKLPACCTHSTIQEMKVGGEGRRRDGGAKAGRK